MTDNIPNHKKMKPYLLLPLLGTLLFVRCSGDKATPTQTGSSESKGVMTSSDLMDPIHDLDEVLRRPVIGTWKLHKEVYDDGSGQRNGDGAYITLRDNGTYEWSGVTDRSVAAGNWRLHYASSGPEQLIVLLFMNDDRNTPDNRNWRQHFYEVSFMDEDGVHYLILREGDRGQNVLYFIKQQ